MISKDLFIPQMNIKNISHSKTITELLGLFKNDLDHVKAPLCRLLSVDPRRTLFDVAFEIIMEKANNEY